MSDGVETRVREVFASVLGVPADALGRESSPETIASWDSLTHISLMLALEEECGVRFEPDELVELRSFGAVLDRVQGP